MPALLLQPPIVLALLAAYVVMVCGFVGVIVYQAYHTIWKPRPEAASQKDVSHV